MSTTYWPPRRGIRGRTNKSAYLHQAPNGPRSKYLPLTMETEAESAGAHSIQIAEPASQPALRVSEGRTCAKSKIVHRAVEKKIR